MFAARPARSRSALEWQGPSDGQSLPTRTPRVTTLARRGAVADLTCDDEAVRSCMRGGARAALLSPWAAEPDHRTRGDLDTSRWPPRTCVRRRPQQALVSIVGWWACTSAARVRPSRATRATAPRSAPASSLVTCSPKQAGIGGAQVSPRLLVCALSSCAQLQSRSSHSSHSCMYVHTTPHS